MLAGRDRWNAGVVDKCMVEDESPEVRNLRRLFCVFVLIKKEAFECAACYGCPAEIKVLPTMGLAVSAPGTAAHEADATNLASPSNQSHELSHLTAASEPKGTRTSSIRRVLATIRR